MIWICTPEHISVKFWIMILNNLTSLRSFTDESGICCSSGQVDLFSDLFFVRVRVWHVTVYTVHGIYKFNTQIIMLPYFYVLEGKKYLDPKLCYLLSVAMFQFFYLRWLTDCTRPMYEEN